MVDKIGNPAAAINAYSNTANLGKNAPVTGTEEAGVSFSDFLRQKASESLDTLKASEQMSAKAVTGEADITDVVQAAGAAEITLQTVVAIRDQLIAAYQELMRMPV